MAVLGPLISAGASLIGGLFGQSAADKQAEMQMASLKKGIQWRVNDANKAGIHPLYALGANIPTYAPVSQAGGLGDAFTNMGQDIGRAVDAGMSRSQRVTSYDSAVQKLTLEKLALENDVTRSQLAGSKLALLRQAGTPPAMPDDINLGALGGVTPTAPPLDPIRKTYGDDPSDFVGYYHMIDDWLFRNTGRRLWTSNDVAQYGSYIEPLINPRVNTRTYGQPTGAHAPYRLPHAVSRRY